MIQFYCYDRCSTCQKAKRYLQNKGIIFQEKAIKSHDLTAKDLEQLHQLTGKPLKSLFNTSGNAYKALNLKDTLDQLSLEEAYQLLAADGMLIKRPILISDQQALFGFKQEAYEEFISRVKRN